jgi:hypothetical protein
LLTPGRLAATSLFQTIAIFLLLGLAGCTQQHSISITDVTQTNILRLASQHSMFISGVSVRLSGHLDGKAIVFVNDQRPYPLSGLIDWKTNQLLKRGSVCVLQYAPQNVRTGQLTVSYFFH